MSWLREDDREVLDDRIGDLTDREYRALHALRQYLAREANETGIFNEKRANRACFSTLKGTLKLTSSNLSRLIQLDLVERIDALSDEYLESLGITRPEGTGWLRPSRWERYNPPRDKTNAERQKRYRDSLRNAESNAVTNASETVPRARGRDRGPVPKTTLTEEQEHALGISSESETMPNTPRPQAPKNGLESLTSPTYFALLHAACGSTDDALEKLRRAARGKPEAVIVVAFEAATGPGVRDPLAVALAELGRRTLA